MINKSHRNKLIWPAVFCIVCFALLMFRAMLVPDTVFLCTDSNIGSLAARKALLPRALIGSWHDNFLAGLAGYMPAGFTNALLFILPLMTFTNWIYPILLVGSSLLLIGFLRRAGLSLPACLLGAMAAFWLSSNFTLSYAGHLGKFGVLFFASLFLWIAGQLPDSSRRGTVMIAAGGAMGMMLTEQADLGLFFALALGPYVLFVLFVKCRVRGWRFLGLVSMLLVMAFAIALRPALEGHRAHIKDVAAVSEADPAARWEFVTQWSWPPEESIDFVAPGYTGWRSGDPAGPYWGRMGRSAGWEKTGRGFQNFRLENVYLGSIPIALALFAMLGAFMTRRSVSGSPPAWEQPGANPEIWFWSAVTLLTLLLAFGKHFPLYYLFYQLPLVGNIRNPNKFLQIFQLSVAILAAYGLDAVLRYSWRRQDDKS